MNVSEEWMNAVTINSVDSALAMGCPIQESTNKHHEKNLHRNRGIGQRNASTHYSINSLAVASSLTEDKNGDGKHNAIHTREILLTAFNRVLEPCSQGATSKSEEECTRHGETGRMSQQG